MIIYVFTKNGEKLPTLPQRDGLDFKHIRFDSTDLEDLLTIARYRIISYPTSIIVDDKGNVLLKVKGSIPSSYIDNIVQEKA
ncbi:MAG: hypothetical protein ACWGQW_18745 [bacterium]